MSQVYVSDERQEQGVRVGEQLLETAWEWAIKDRPDYQPTAFRRMFSAVQLLLSAVEPGEERMAISAIGAVLGVTEVQRPDLDIKSDLVHGFEEGARNERQTRGTVQ